MAQRRQTESTKLPHLLRGDLDWIVMKALDKDRRRRYETANGFASDLQRFLNNEAVVARPPSSFYRLQKVVRRNKLAFGAASAVVVALAVGLAVSTAMYLRARTEAIRSAQVGQFLKDILASVDPGVAMGRDTALMRDILDKATDRLGGLTNQPSVAADLQFTLARTYFELQEPNKAAAMALEALATYRRLFGNKHPDVVRSLNACGITLRPLGRYEEAETLLKEALATQTKLSGHEDPMVARLLNNLGNVLRERGKFKEAEDCHREALVLQRRIDPERAALTLYDLANDYQREGKLEDAAAMFRDSLESYRRLAKSLVTR